MSFPNHLTPSSTRRYPTPTPRQLLIFLILLFFLLHLQKPTSLPKQPSIEIFSAPKPFTTSSTQTTLSPIQSWKSLSLNPRITLVGHHPSISSLAKQHNLHHTSAVDTSFLGVPLFHSLFSLANASSADIAIIVNADIFLFEDFVRSLLKVYTSFDNFLLIAARHDLPHFPPSFLRDSHTHNNLRTQFVSQHAALHTQGGMDIWAWNTNGPRLFDPVMPPFVFGRGKYDNWFTHETISAARRHVVDVSETCYAVHVKHDYALGKTDLDDGQTLQNSSVQSDPPGHAPRRRLASFWSYGKLSKFELFTNIYLSLRSGSYENGMGTTRHAPWKLAACYEQSGMCLIRRHRPGLCYCEYSPFIRQTQTDPRLNKKGFPKPRCVEQSVESKDVYSLPVSLPPGKTEADHFGLPLTAVDAINAVVINNTIILSALNFGYRSMMMNWVCNMRSLGITNFVIAALDPQLYLYAYTRGIATYLEDSFEKGLEQDRLSTEGTYGTVLFKKLTKMKTQVVTRILRLGYNVVWSDCDIVFFKNPVQYLWDQNADLVIQSNAPDTEAANSKQRINSGFYLVRNTEQMRAAFDDIVKHALHSRKSEQPSFYDVLCGEQMQNTVGRDGCLYNGLTIKLLDRRLFPNGNTLKIWDSAAGTIEKKFPDLFILHNNWVVGVNNKEERLRRHGMIRFNSEDETCRLV